MNIRLQKGFERKTPLIISNYPINAFFNPIIPAFHYSIIPSESSST